MISSWCCWCQLTSATMSYPMQLGTDQLEPEQQSVFSWECVHSVTEWIQLLKCWHLHVLHNHKLSTIETHHVIGFTLKSCTVNRNTCLSHSPQSMADSSRSQTWTVLTFFERRQWSFFLSPVFSFFLSLTETENALGNFFHTVPVHSNESIVSEHMQAVQLIHRGEQWGEKKKNPDYFGAFSHAHVKCGVSTLLRDLPGILHTGLSCVPSGVVK